MPDQALILVIEDSSADILLVRRAFSQAKLTNPLQVVTNGEEAIAYLSGTGKYENRTEFPLPTLVLLDLKMPGIDGFEVLAWIRKNPNLRGLRVVVLTSSDDTKDVNRACQLGANSFLVKPLDFGKFRRNRPSLKRLLGLVGPPARSVASAAPR
jgi:CheY-like chemotaxis protein